MTARGDRELWQRAATGDEEAFTILYRRHVTSVWQRAHRLTGSSASADDLTAMAFLTVWRHKEDLILEHESAWPWLCTVVSNLARNEFRRTQRWRQVLSRIPVETTTGDHAQQIADAVTSQDRLCEVRAAVDQLPPSEREAVRLCLLDGMSTAEAAVLLGVAEVSVRSRISRARGRLRTMFPDNPTG